MERLFAKALWYWWIILLVTMGLGGNACLAVTSFNQGAIGGALVFAGLFAGSSVLCYRTYREAASVRAMLRNR